ncbi:MAG: hypothetical protein MI975_07515 [Cytophagales bacterium]|nr:hypothetical protein [Cytophagales bacterium]
MKQLLVCISFISVLSASCHREKPVKFYVGKPKVVDFYTQKKEIDPKLKFQFGNLNLYQKMEDINLEQFKKYGTFYTRDFNIYQVNNLDLLEDNQYITEIYLYFIGDTLHKIQAFTTKNMSDFFLSKYGGARLVLKDRFNKNLAMTEGAVRKRSGQIVMNKNLSNYKLKWKDRDRLISYQVDETAQKNFEALEELVDLEHLRKIEVKPMYVFTIQSDKYNQLLSRVKNDEAMATLKKL